MPVWWKAVEALLTRSWRRLRYLARHPILPRLTGRTADADQRKLMEAKCQNFAAIYSSTLLTLIEDDRQTLPVGPIHITLYGFLDEQILAGSNDIHKTSLEERIDENHTACS
jgi:hypothetical protein